MRDYIVLRNLAAVSTREPSGGTRSYKFKTRAAGISFPDYEFGLRSEITPPEAVIEVHSLGEKDVPNIVRRADVAAVSPVMPTALIKPFACEGPQTSGNWGVGAVKADSSSCTGDGVTVAVLDTGIDASHPAFQGVEIVEKDFTGTGNGDGNGHGTHCAGIIFGRDVNGVRIGVACGVKRALIGKVLTNSGSGSTDMILKGIQWAVQEGAQVVSMSLGFDFGSTVKYGLEQGLPVEVATSKALEAYRGNLRMFDELMRFIGAEQNLGLGAVIAAAAGNESLTDKNPDFRVAASLPAAAEDVIAVGALQQGADGLSVAPFSNTYPQISAPGVGIVSAKFGGGLVALSGTSMACPHVAGVAALWWEWLRKAKLRATASIVTAKLLANARTGGLTADAVPADYGVGLVTAPA